MRARKEHYQIDWNNAIDKYYRIEEGMYESIFATTI